VKRCLSGSTIAAAWLVLVTVGAARAAEPGYTFKSLARLDTTVAGEMIHGDFEVGGVNASGTVVFVTELDNGEGAILLEPDGKAQLLLKKDEDAPDGGKWGGNVPNKIGINDAGNIAMSVGVDFGEGEANAVLFYDKSANKWTVVMKSGMPAPGGGTFQGSQSFAGINNANDIVFIGTVDEPSSGFNGQAVYLWSGGKLTEIVRAGAKVGNTTLTDPRRVQINDAGIITFEDKTDADAGGVYVWKDGTITEIATLDTEAPDGGGKFTELRGVTANSSGDVAFLAKTDAGQGAYFYSAKDKKLVKVAAPGDEVPGGKLVNVAYDFRNNIRIGDDGSVLFVGQSENGSGLYLWKDGKISVVAQTGEEMKGLGKAKSFAGTGGIGGGGLALSSNGLIAFPVQTEDDVTHLVLATPGAAPTAGQ
jgi:hypothetical protein